MEAWSADKNGLSQRKMTQKVPVKGVPFLSETRHVKTMMIVYKNNDNFKIDMDN